MRRRAADRLMGLDDVVGVGLGEDENGDEAIVVLAERELPGGLVPPEIEGRPVRVQIVGEVRGGPPPEEEGR